MMIAEGEHVLYVGNGEPDAPLAHGDYGVVVMSTGDGSHVHWKSGECEDHISLTSNKRLQVIESLQSTPESGYTEVEPMVHLAVCPTCSGEGMVPQDFEE